MNWHTSAVGKSVSLNLARVIDCRNGPIFVDGESFAAFDGSSWLHYFLEVNIATHVLVILITCLRLRAAMVTLKFSVSVLTNCSSSHNTTWFAL